MKEKKRKNKERERCRKEDREKRKEEMEKIKDSRGVMKRNEVDNKERENPNFNIVTKEEERQKRR